MKKTAEERLFDWLKKHEIKTDKYDEVIWGTAREVFEYVVKNFQSK